ncbi:RNA-binding protein [Arachis hypogaea]|nr:RNA-binding protein [Arachis hypogaea]
MESFAPKSLKEHADAPDHSSRKGSMCKETGDTSKHDVNDDGISSRKPRKNTFVVPRNVRPLGVTANSSKKEKDDEKPKSNDKFKKMFIR